MKDLALLEKVRDRLEAVRTHIQTNWIKGSYFQTPWNDKIEDFEPMPQVCLAGGVMYSLNLTDEQNIDRKDVVPVMMAIYDALPEKSRGKRTGAALISSCQALSHAEETGFISDAYSMLIKERNLCKNCYNDGVISAITLFNDMDSRTKSQVLDVIDKSIKKTIDQMSSID